MKYDPSRDPQIIKDFVDEFKEHSSKMEQDILKLEKEPNNTELLNDIFRPVHSMKGVASFLNFEVIIGFSHKLENLLDALRKGKIHADSDLINLLLASLDIMTQLVGDVAKGGDGSKVNTKIMEEQIIKMLDQRLGTDKGKEESKKEVEKKVKTKQETRKAKGGKKKKGENKKVQIFLGTAMQYYNNMVKTLIEIEQGKKDNLIFDNMLRAINGLKKAAGFMRFDNMINLMESFKDLLDEIKKGEITINPEVLNLTREFVGKCEEILEGIETNGQDVVNSSEFVTQYKNERKPAVRATSAGSGAGGGNGGNGKGYEGKTGVSGSVIGEGSIRVSMDKLDLLMNLIGELMIYKSRFEMLNRKVQEKMGMSDVAGNMRETTTAMDRLTEDLHTAIMDTRMVPVNMIFSKFPRVVRDLARSKKKVIELKMNGEETEIDKTLIEGLNDPLTHLIRNAVDHGIETPEERLGNGKSSIGTIHLKSYHESGSVVIEIEDDGRGMDAEKIKKKALSSGIVTEEEVSKMSEMEALGLIFRPGFSTAEVITDISGRGVGMDVVKTNIEKLKGKISIHTQLGKGSRIVLKMPLTMAIMEALLVKVGEESFAIPLLAVNAITKVRKEDLKDAHGRKVLNIYGKTLGTVALGDILEVKHNGVDNVKIPVILLEAKAKNGESVQFGFVVDGVEEKEKIVIKSLDETMIGKSGLSGVTILGNGRVALILDPVELVNMTLEKYG